MASPTRELSSIGAVLDRAALHAEGVLFVVIVALFRGLIRRGAFLVARSEWASVAVLVSTANIPVQRVPAPAVVFPHGALLPHARGHPRRSSGTDAPPVSILSVASQRLR